MDFTNKALAVHLLPLSFQGWNKCKLLVLLIDLKQSEMDGARMTQRGSRNERKKGTFTNYLAEIQDF